MSTRNMSSRGTVAALYEAHQYACMDAALKVTGGDRALAEDALHNAFLQLLRDPAPVTALPSESQRRRLVIICKNKAIDLLRKDKRLVCTDFVEAPLLSEDPAQKAESRDESLRLARCVAKLPDLYRDILELRYTEELSLKEIAKLLEITSQSAAVRLHRGRALLTDILRKEGFR